MSVFSREPLFLVNDSLDVGEGFVPQFHGQRGCLCYSLNQGLEPRSLGLDPQFLCQEFYFTLYGAGDAFSNFRCCCFDDHARNRMKVTRMKGDQ